jgi:hypothetical protein
MRYELVTLVLLAAFFLGMLGIAAVGHRHGRRRVSAIGEEAGQGTGVVEAALFALLGLLIAFTFATAYSRLNVRRDLVVQEANAIGTAYLRLDLLAPEAKAPLRAKFKDYIASRRAFWQELTDVPAAKRELARAGELQNQIWTSAVAATEGNQPARMLLLPALNAMIDITTTRLSEIRAHPPPIVFVMLFALALLCAWAIGYAMAKACSPNWLHVAGYAAIVTLTIYVILDIEYPRYGLVRLDVTHELIGEGLKDLP